MILLPAWGAWVGGGGRGGFMVFGSVIQPRGLRGAYAHQSPHRRPEHYQLFSAGLRPRRWQFNKVIKLFCYGFSWTPPDPLPKHRIRPAKSMVQWLTALPVAHTAYWGENLIPGGTDGTASQFREGKHSKPTRAMCWKAGGIRRGTLVWKARAHIVA